MLDIMISFHLIEYIYIWGGKSPHLWHKKPGINHDKPTTITKIVPQMEVSVSMGLPVLIQSSWSMTTVD